MAELNNKGRGKSRQEFILANDLMKRASIFSLEAMILRIVFNLPVGFAAYSIFMMVEDPIPLGTYIVIQFLLFLAPGFYLDFRTHLHRKGILGCRWSLPKECK